MRVKTTSKNLTLMMGFLALSFLILLPSLSNAAFALHSGEGDSILSIIRINPIVPIQPLPVINVEIASYQISD